MMRRNTIPEPIAKSDAVPRKQRERTRDALIAEAVKMTHHGHFGSIVEVANAAGISRATAYRYFPNQARLIHAVLDVTLGPVRSFDTDERDGIERIRILFERTFPLFKEFEPQFRAALQVSLDHWSQDRAGTLREEPFQRGRRVKILQRAAAPLKRQLGPTVYGKLVRALSLVYGIEPYVVLKDMWNANDRDVDSLTRWVVEALISAALQEAKRG